MLFTVLHLVKTVEIIHQIQAKDVRKPLVILVFGYRVVFGPIFPSYDWSISSLLVANFPCSYFWFIGLWIVIYYFIGLIYWIFLWIFNFVRQHVIWTDLYAFEIRADRCVLVAIFGASYLWYYVNLDCDFWWKVA